jgi:membrane-bound lytic murein transglycosylase D
MEPVAEQRNDQSGKRAEDKTEAEPTKTKGRNFVRPRGTSDRTKRAIALGTAAAAIGGLGAAVTRSGEAPPQPSEPAPGPVALNEAESYRVLNVSKAWDIEQTKNEQVDFFIEFLQFRNRDKTKLWMERLGKYGPMIQQKLAERDMPQDLLWLATIESGMNPNAYSKAAAAGLWQFIEETGERHGLEVTKYVDERRDPVKSTDAALDYLSKLNKRFGGSWYLTAAGYNTGENRVERIVRERAGGRMGDESVFWQIDSHLPSETRDYVPLMLAMGHIGKDPHKYGFTDLEMQQPLSYDEVKVAGGVPLSKVAESIGVPAADVYDLNPHLIKKMTPPDREWSVRIPKDKAAQFAANFGIDSAPASGDAAAE